MRVRHVFTAPVVVIVACGASTPPISDRFYEPHRSWMIENQGDDACYYEPDTGCDDCNPPALVRVRCLYGDDELVDVHEVDGKCWATEPLREVICPDQAELSSSD